MKKIFLFLLFVSLFSQNIVAQTPQVRLWGSTGTNASMGSQIPGYGSIFSVNSDGSDFLTHKQFAPNSDGSIPFGALTKLANGDLVGTTQEGGTNDFGVIYKLNSNGSGYSKIFEFNTNTGFAPKGKLLQASNGHIYGTTSSSKNGNEGIIFRIKTDGSEFANLHHFSQTEGISPFGGLIEGSDGNLYGMTTGGGTGHWGTVFRIALDGTGFQKLMDFDGTIDNNPWGELVEGLDGYLYGSSNGRGVFKLNKNGSDFQRIHTLDQNSQGIGSLIKLSNGDLVGAASGGANNRSFLFSIKPDGTNFTVLYNLNILIKGNITLSPSGQIYGVADDYGTGVVFRIETNGTGFTTLYSAGGFDNGVEQRNVIETSPGLLIGIASKGGASNNGAVFKLTTAGVFTKLKDFQQEGADPESELIKASDGDLYGTTTSGGTYGWGTIYKIKVDGTGYTKVFDFDGINGRTPIGRLVELPGGFLCGTTKKGGVFLQGNVFKVKLDGTGFVSLKDFDVIFINPTGDLVFSIDGFLYGTTASQNSNSLEKGVIYKVHPDGTDFSVVVDFATVASTIGTNPIGVRQMSTGDLLGVTTRGGSNFSGTIFKVKTNGTNAVKLRDLDFSYLNVASKNVPIEAPNGKLYGTNFLNSYLYSLNSDGTGYTEYPSAFVDQSYGNLLELSAGALYGTSIGGSIFKFDLNTSSFTKLVNGPLDLAFANSSSYSGLLALGKQNQTITFDQIPTPKNFGDPSFALLANSSSALAVNFVSSEPAVATVSGSNVTIVGAGTTTITARQSGNAVIASAIDAPQTLTVNKANQIITFNSIAAKTFGDASFTLSATTNSSLLVSYSSSNETVATIAGNAVTIVGAGSTNITAKQVGNTNYNAATEVVQTLTVNKANQTITFSSMDAKTFGDASFTLSATTNSSLPVSYSSSNETVATIAGNAVTIVGAGSTNITAKQAGNTNYNAATEVVQVLTVNKANQTIDFPPIFTKTFEEVPFTLSATSTSGLAIQYSTASDKISISGNRVTLIKPGIVSIKADQVGSTNFNVAAVVSQSFCINPSKPTITATGLNSGTPVLTSSSSTGNQWYKNGALVTDEVSNTFSPKNEGAYTVKVTIDNCASELSAEQVLVITGEIQSTKKTEFYVYPNPVSNILTISLTAFDDNSEVSIVIYDLLGKAVDKISGLSETVSISVGAYPSGSYVVKASQRNQTHVAKFTKE